MNPTPPDWPRIASCITYRDPAKAIDWLCEAFGFEVRLKVEGDDGQIVHSELEFGDGLIMVSGEGGWNSDPGRPFMKSPRSLGDVNTQNLMVYVDDVLAHYERAKAAGATITREPTVSDYGPDYWSDRGYGCTDIDGHTWYFAQRLRNPGA